MPKLNFISPEFWTKFQKEVPLFLKIPEFPTNTVQDKWKKTFHAKNQLDSFSHFDRTPTCDRHRHGQTHTGHS